MTLFKITLMFVTILGLYAASSAARAKDPSPSAKENSMATAYDFSFKTIDGQDLPLSTYKGHPVLVVNTASRCGFTPQYEGLQKLYDTYKGRGLVVLGVPANNFMGQEPGSNAEIKKFCETNFAINFPMTEKVSVKGDDAHPFYQWAAQQDKGDTPGWNFHKFLIGPDGSLVQSFGSRTKPDDKDLIEAITPLLSP